MGTPVRRILGGAILHFLPVPADTDDDERNRIDAEFMRSVLASSDDCIKVLDLDANLIFMSEGGQRVMDVSDFNLIRGCPWPDFWQDKGNIDAKAAVKAALSGGAGRFQGAAQTMAGTLKWWDVQVTPILGPDGKPTHLLSISRDITGLKDAERRQHLLTQELGHRMKNMLAMVQAISQQTFRDQTPLDKARDAFSTRLMALSAAQDILLLGEDIGEARLHDLVESVQRVYAPGSDRISFAGPDVTLGPKGAISLSLALHELSTNAVKYGALSKPGGRIRIDWECTRQDERFRLQWQEAGGPAVETPRKFGFGSRMIKRALEGEDGVSADISYLADGVRFDLDAPQSFLRKA